MSIIYGKIVLCIKEKERWLNFQFAKDKSVTRQRRDSRSKTGRVNAKEKSKDSQPRPEPV